MKKHLRGAAVLAPLLVLACQQILSIDGEVTISGPVDTCGLAVRGGSCQACVASQCCTQASSCAQDPACAGLETCLLGCGTDYGCRSACVFASSPGAGPAIPTMDQCVTSRCGPECGISCGVVGSYTEPDAAQSCQDCISAHDCNVSEACTTSLSCELVAHCAYSCVTPDCQNACVAMDDAGAFTALAYGVGSTCLSPCRVGQYWPCVGNVTWPFATTKSIDVTLTVTDSTTGNPVPGVAIKACTRGDPTCASFLDSRTTVANGQATLTISRSVYPLGFEGYFDLTSSANSIVHYLYFLGYPLTVPHAQISVLTISPTAFAGLQKQAGITVQPSRGTVAVAANDCLLLAAQGVTFTANGIDPQTTLVYFQGGIPNAAATSTDTSGLAFYLNAPAQPITIQATPQPIGRVSSTVSVFAVPGAISFVQALPTP